VFKVDASGRETVLSKLAAFLAEEDAAVSWHG